MVGVQDEDAGTGNGKPGTGRECGERPDVPYLPGSCLPRKGFATGSDTIPAPARGTGGAGRVRGVRL